MNVRDRNVVVLGLGVTGLSAARWAARHGAQVSVADTRRDPPRAHELAAELPQVTLTTGPFTDATLARADLILLSPGLARRQAFIERAVARGAELVGDIELFARAMPHGQKLLAITGSNGKTTVSTLTGELARAAGLRTDVIGNIGEPVLDVLATYEQCGTWPDVLVVELSSFQLETTSSLRATAATVLNVTENHLDRYHGMDDYADAKARIFLAAEAQVLNRDDARSRAMAIPGRGVQTFGSDTPATDRDWGLGTRDGTAWLMRGDLPLLAADELALVGRHNALNALAALALVSHIAPVSAALLGVLATFHGLQHRVERVAEIGGVLFVNDSKGTTVAATQAALDGIGRPAILIAGGDGKGQSFASLKASVDAHARAVILLGRDAPILAAALAGTPAQVERAATIEAAVARAIALARPGDVVLLSPACASLDMFRDYVERGERFTAAVMAHAQEAEHA